jgi:hypothetical protein
MFRIAVYLAFFLFSLTAVAQKQVLVYDTTNSGIPSNEIRALFFDKNDHLWVGTEDKGIGMFDGNFWTYYNTSNTPLQSNLINDIQQHFNGDMWFSTGDGIAVLSGGNWTVYQVPDVPVSDHLYLRFDSKGNVFTLSPGKKYKVKLFKFDGNLWTVQSDTILSRYKSIPSDFIIDQNDEFWTRGGLTHSSSGWIGGIPLSNYYFDSFDPAIEIDKNNTIWTTMIPGSDPKGGNVISYDGSNVTVHKEWFDYGGATDGIIAANPYNGEVWYANQNSIGSSYYDGTIWHKPTALNAVFDSLNKVTANSKAVKAITFDKQGHVWMGLNKAGAYKKEFPDFGGIIVYNEKGVTLEEFLVGERELTVNDAPTLFPNPSKGKVEITWPTTAPKGPLQMQIINLQGKVLMQKTVSSNTKQLNLDNLPAGNYLVHFENDKGFSANSRIVLVTE